MSIRTNGAFSLSYLKLFLQRWEIEFVKTYIILWKKVILGKYIESIQLNISSHKETPIQQFAPLDTDKTGDIYLTDIDILMNYR